MGTWLREAGLSRQDPTAGLSGVHKSEGHRVLSLCASRIKNGNSDIERKLEAERTKWVQVSWLNGPICARALPC